MNGISINASWSLECHNNLPAPFISLMTFKIQAVEGKSVDDAAFSIMFNQGDDDVSLSMPMFGGSGAALVISNQTFSDDEVAVDEVAAPVNTDNEYDIEQELIHIEWLKAQVEELVYQIYEKEEALAIYVSENFDPEIEECDTLRCVMKIVYHKVRVTAHKVVHKIRSKIAGHRHRHHEADDLKRPRPPFRKPHWKRPHWRRPPFHHRPKHGDHSHHNHTCHHPHGNYSHHHPRPPPPPPFCHCPPPPPLHGKPPHGSPKGPPSRHPPHPHSPQHGVPQPSTDEAPPVSSCCTSSGTIYTN